MIITKTKYKDVLAIELKTSRYTALVLPTEGGKIASFKENGCDKEYLLQNPSEKYLHVGMHDSYVDGECSGFDDMFPTIDAVSITGKDGKTLAYPDHGEVCRVSFDYKITQNELQLVYVSPIFNYKYEKMVGEDKDGGIVISYKITNLSNQDFSAIWTAHCLLPAEKCGQIEVPFYEGQPTDVMFDFTGQLKAGQTVGFKREYLLSEWEDGVPRLKKFYFPKRPERGVMGYKYPDGKTFVLEFDKDEIPIVGVWKNYGFIKGYYCIGLEPSTGGYDTPINASEKGNNVVIKGGENLSFKIKLSLADDT